jgi:hypothetical protein
MKPFRVAALLGTSLLAFAGCASMSSPPTGAAALPSPPGKDDCLFFRTLDDWTPIDRERLIVYGPGRVPYLATLSFPSHDMLYSIGIAFLDSDNDGRFCGHGFDSILVRDGLPDRISLRSLQRIEKADAKVLVDATNPRHRARKAEKVEGAAAPAEPKAP